MGNQRNHRTNARQWASRIAAVCLALGVPGASWWLIGDQSTVAPSLDPTYAVRPLPIDPDIERLMGIGSAVLVAAALVVLAWTHRQGRAADTGWPMLAPLVAAGALVGVGWRIVTAGVSGANIGGGLVVLFGGPVVALLILWSLVRFVVVLGGQRRSRRAPVLQAGCKEDSRDF